MSASICIGLLMLAVTQESGDDVTARILEACRNIRTLECEFETGMYTESDDGGGEWGEEFGTLAFARPNRIALETESASIFCDGKTLWIYAPYRGEYVESPAPDSIDLDVVEEAGDLYVRFPLLAYLLTAGEERREIIKDTERFTGGEEEVRDGRPGVRVRGVRRRGDPESEYPCSFWVDGESGLPGEIRLNVSYAYNDYRPAGPGEDGTFRWRRKYEHFQRYARVRVDGEIPGERFVFRPGLGDVRVDAFENHDDWESTRILKMLGETLPEIAARTLEGEEIELPGSRGRVLLLVTWYENCAEILPKAQALAGSLADHPVTVLGICHELLSNEEDVKEIQSFLQTKGIRLRHVDDRERQIDRTLNGALTLLVDKEGIVQYAHPDHPDDFEAYVGGMIRDLLQGKAIHDPEDIRARIERQEKRAADSKMRNDAVEAIRRKALGEEDPATRLPFRTGDLEEVSRSYHAVYKHGQPRSFDLDGDERPEGWMRANDRAIVIHDENLFRPRAIQIGTSGDLMGVEPVRLGGKLHWIARIRFYPEGEAIGLYDGEGTTIWEFRYEVPEEIDEDMQLIAGDLDGDGQEEILAGVTWESRGDILVFDRTGKRIAEKTVGKEIQFLRVMSDSSIFCVVEDDRIRRFRFAPPGKGD